MSSVLETVVLGKAVPIAVRHGTSEYGVRGGYLGSASLAADDGAWLAVAAAGARQLWQH